MTDQISDILGIEVIEVVDQTGTSHVLPPEANGNEEDVDFNYVRANHYLLATQTADAMSIAMRIARESEQPKAIEALSKLLKTASEVNRQLLLLSKDRAETKQSKKGNGSTPSQGGTTIQANNVVFTGSSSDLNKLLKEQK